MQRQDSAHAPHQGTEPMVHPGEISGLKSTADDGFLQVRQTPGRQRQIKLLFQHFVERSLQSCGQLEHSTELPPHFPQPWSDAHQRRAAVRSTAALSELVSPVAKLREAFLIQKLFEDLWPGFQCQAHELYPAFDILGDIINQSCPPGLV